MRRFAALYDELDSTTATSAKVDALAGYFREAPPADAAWAVQLLRGERLKRLITGRTLRLWAVEATGLPAWLVDECHAAVGDSAETVALLLDELEAAPSEDVPLADWIEARLLPLRGLSTDEQYQRIVDYWRRLVPRERFVLNKLLTGAFRVGVSRLLVARALARIADTTQDVISHRLMGDWRPSAEAYRALLSGTGDGEDRARPYPFFLASPFDGPPEELGPVGDWLAEWKWDGIRAQLVRRGEVHIWSRGEELVTDRFPEIVEAADSLPDSVLDGEILAWDERGVMPFAVLQRRIGRLRPSPAIRKEAPVRFVAYDLLEADGRDVRALPLVQRRARLEETIAGTGLAPSPLLEAASWDELARLRERAREEKVEGLMLKRKGSPYGTGRRRGDWWKWKVVPRTIDAVLVYAQPGSGRRADLFTDYTLAVWRDDELVPVAKAYSGLSDEEIAALDRWIRRHTVERFGPVRRVEPVQVLEIAFEGLQPSSRHKAGLALRFPRIERWRRDKPAAEADRLGTLQELLEREAAR